MWLPNRSEAIELLRTHVSNENLVRHCIATEAIMRSLARRLGRDEELWGITGLLHDLDLEIVDYDDQVHGRTTVKMLSERGYPQEGLEAILAHNGEALGVPCRTEFEHCLTAAETITGLIVACTLVYQSRKVADVKVKSIRKRMKEKRFAANVKRDRIWHIEQVGITLDDFIALSLAAMVPIGDQLGL